MLSYNILTRIRSASATNSNASHCESVRGRRNSVHNGGIREYEVFVSMNCSGKGMTHAHMNRLCVQRIIDLREFTKAKNAFIDPKYTSVMGFEMTNNV